MRQPKLAADQRETVADIQAGRQKETHATWKSYSIVNALRYAGATREDAQKAQAWARHADPGETIELEPNITITIREEKT